MFISRGYKTGTRYKKEDILGLEKRFLAKKLDVLIVLNLFFIVNGLGISVSDVRKCLIYRMKFVFNYVVISYDGQHISTQMIRLQGKAKIDFLP